MLASADSAFACSCAFEDEAKRFQRSDAAVVARLVDVVPVDDQPANPSSPIGPAVADYHYRLLRIFKGPRRLHEGDEIVIRGNTSSAACGMPTQERRYAFYLHRYRRSLSTNLCSLTSRGAMKEAAAQAGAASRPASASQACAPAG